MRWQGREGSKNVEDRRGLRGPVMGGGLLIVIIGAIFALLSGANPLQVMQQVGVQLQQQNAGQLADDADPHGQRPDDTLAEFSSVVFKDLEDVWNSLFPEHFNRPYQMPGLVLYDGNVETRGCGVAGSAVGPFYCGGDSKVYIDLSFFNELQTRFKAPGEFACAYVIAHEVGHHVQNQIGWLEKVQREQQTLSKVESNRLLVRLELQADFLAGVWAHHAQRMKGILESGDVESGLRAAAAVGDDTIMRNAGQRVVLDAFTHGSSEQRMKWFSLGLRTGDLNHLMDMFELPYDEL
ncbi:MAG: zinc metallopeptidase [Pirellulaceae bacterium]|nr:zinc metallopeptidase [Pirellulaceae bacterium]